MEPHVELGEMEAEDLDPPSKRCQRPVAMRVPLFASRLLASTSRSASSSLGRSYPSLPSRHQMNESLRRYGSSSLRRPIVPA